MATSTATRESKLQTEEKQLQDQIRILNEKVFSRRQKDAEDTMSSGKLFQTFGAAAGNALLPTVCKQTEDTARRSVTAEGSARRPSRNLAQGNALCLVKETCSHVTRTRNLHTKFDARFSCVCHQT